MKILKRVLWVVGGVLALCATIFLGLLIYSKVHSELVRSDRARQVRELAESGTAFTLYTLDPLQRASYETNTDEIFHGFGITGKATLRVDEGKAL